MSLDCYKRKLAYQNDAMTRPVCLVCGDNFGKYEYRGKSVCTMCLEYIHTNF